jgi:ribosomal protein L11 methyltransferase
MNYISVHLKVSEPETKEILIALLSEEGYTGFEDIEIELIADIPEGDFDEVRLKALLMQFACDYSIENIEQQNWNKVWESNFEPIILPGFCTIKAAFHRLEVETPFCIEITPKMSFGTGHHATTQLMLEAMRHLDFNAKNVLDFGSGTGILAIMAEKMGANHVLAIDNDSWCYENALENVDKNSCMHVEVKHATIDEAKINRYNIVLANINRHILCDTMSDLFALLSNKGYLLMSGLLTEDESFMRKVASEAGFSIEKVTTLDNWISILCSKSI